MSAALALCALPSASQSTPAPVILRIAAGLTDGTTPLLYAQSTGMFARAGITVELQRPQGGAATAAAIVGGALEIGKSSGFELFSAHARGVPLVWIVPSSIYNGDAPDAGMIVLKSSTIRTGRDLNGKIVATTVLNDLNTISTRAWIDQNGGDSSTVHFVELPPATMPAALEAGRVDAATTLNPIFQQAIASGNFRIVAPVYSAVAKHMLVAAWFTSAAYADAHRDVIERFERVMLEANAYCNTHFSETAPLLASYTGVDVATVAHMTRAVTSLYLDPRDVQPLIDVAAKYKIVDHAFPASDLFSPIALKPPHG